ncbi:MAG: exonuclease domain-containing protein [Desulfobacterales bacterium]
MAPSGLTPTYLFYDLETTGLNPAFDQILQFAALRSDAGLKEIERVNLRIALRPDVIPSPDALLTHAIGIQQAISGDCCEFDGLGEIHRRVNTPGTVSLGYNSLGFDDDFLRFGFYRNLLTPYTHQYARGCRRMDLLPIAILYWLYGPSDLLHWPNEAGKPTLKLEHLSRANALAAGPAHDALVDVSATAALARRFQQAREMWDYVLGYFDKAEDARRCQALPRAIPDAGGDYRLGIAVESQLGFQRMFQAPVLALGDSSAYRNQTLWLRLDSETLGDAAAGNFDQSTWVIRKKYGEPAIILPPLARYWEKLTQPAQAQAKANLDLLARQLDLLAAITQYHRQYRYPEIPDVDLDAALFEVGFLQSHEEALCREFRQADLQGRAEMVARFERKELRQLAGRIFGRNFPDQMPGHLAAAYEAYLRRVADGEGEGGLKDYRGEFRTTPGAALARIDQLKTKGEAADPAELKLLDDLADYIRRRFAVRTKDTGG